MPGAAVAHSGGGWTIVSYQFGCPVISLPVAVSVVVVTD